MKAVRLSEISTIESHPLEFVEVEPPLPQVGQVRIKVQACGLCHTDLHEIEGQLKLPKLPLIPGHQVVGIVDQFGPQVANLKVGDRVGLAWLGHTCGQCRFCLSDHENLCENAQFTGYHFDGGYAEYAVAFADFVYPVPDNVPAVSVAPLLCAGIIGYRSLRLSEIKPGQRLGLYGFGASAHIAIQVAMHWGCEVYVFSRSAEHRKLAEKLGAVWTGKINDPLPKKLHGSVIFAPVGSIVPAAMEHLEKAGACALAGIYMSDIPPLDYEKHLYHEKILRSVTASTRRDGMELMELAGEIDIETTTQEFPLEQTNEALQLLKTGKINGAAVLKIS
jgi:propanol-preferring alcohol dehydrogenase